MSPDWPPCEPADRCVMRGSDDPGDPIEVVEAQEIIAALGFPPGKLDEPRP